MRGLRNTLYVLLWLFFLLNGCPATAIYLGQSADVRLGARRTTRDELEYLKKHPQITSANFNIEASQEKEFEDISRLNQLLTLKLTFEQANPNLTRLSRLRNIESLELTFNNGLERPAERLAVLQQLPGLKNLGLTVCEKGDRQEGNEASPAVLVIPRVKLSSLHISSNACVFDFSRDFPFANLQSLEVEAPLRTQSVFASMHELKSLELGWNFKFDSEGLKSLAAIHELESITSHTNLALPLYAWARVKSLEVPGLAASELGSVFSMPELQSLKTTLSPCPRGVLTRFKSLSKLKQLHVSLKDDTNTDELLSALFSCKKLEDLSLYTKSWTGMFLEKICSFNSLKKLTIQSVSGDCLTPEQATMLRSLVNLEELSVPWCPQKLLSCLKSCGDLPHLKRLSLDAQDFCDKDLDVLKHFPGLEELDLSGKKITDAATQVLASLKQLRVLHLTRTSFTGEHLADLTSLPHLKELHINATQITDSTLAKVPLSSNTLEFLDLSATKVTGPGLSALDSLSSLRTLGLASCPIDDQSLKFLSSKSLEQISVENTEITEHGIETLSALPKLQYVVAYECGINPHSKPPGQLAVASQTGWFDYDYDGVQGLWAFPTLIRSKVAARGLNDKKEEEFYASVIQGLSNKLEGLLHPKYHVCSMMATGHAHDVFNCYLQRGSAYASSGNYEAAQKDLDIAVRIARSSAFARASRAYVYLKQNQLDKALKDINRAIDIKPGLVVAYLYRSQIDEAAGNADAAKTDRQTYEQLNSKRREIPAGFKPDDSGLFLDFARQ
jgi:Leucine-rich repeat (LRR) protein